MVVDGGGWVMDNLQEPVFSFHHEVPGRGNEGLGGKRLYLCSHLPPLFHLSIKLFLSLLLCSSLFQV